jgi:hypothetical protein
MKRRVWRTNTHRPSPSLRGFVANCSPRTRSAEALLAEVGLRLESIRNYDKTDCLTIGDLPEITVTPNEEPMVCFVRVPTMIIVRQELSRAIHQHFTFLRREECEFLAEYLAQTIKSGEVLDPSHPARSRRIK